MLNKIKQAQKEGRILPDVVVDYENVMIDNSIDIITSLYPQFKEVLKNDSLSYKLEFEQGQRIINISYLQDFEPDYYIVRLSTHDGTLLFVDHLYEDIVKSVVVGTAYCKENAPENYADEFWNYDLDYTLGDIYYFRDFGMKNINGHMMAGEDDVMIMPVKIKYNK